MAFAYASGQVRPGAPTYTENVRGYQEHSSFNAPTLDNADPAGEEKERKMAIQFREEINYQGLSGITIMTFKVIAYENLQQDDCKRHGGKPPVSLADEMRYSDKNYIWFPNPYSGTVNRVTFEELLREYEGMDFENAFLQISTRFRASRPF
jgi:hypothetical protein